jgi:hypothetical protein
MGRSTARRIAVAIAATCSLAAATIALSTLASRRPREGSVVNTEIAEGSTSQKVQPEPEEPESASAYPATPEYAPPMARDTALAAFVNRNASARVPSDITTRIPRIRFEEDIPAVVVVLMDTADDDTVRNEAARLLRRSEYPELTDRLTKVLNDPMEGSRFRSFCVQHLWENLKGAGAEERTRITATLQRALDDRSAEVRREALLALVRMKDPKGEEAALRWLTEQDARDVRDIAIRCVHKLDLREHIPTIREHLRADNELDRIAAIVTLSQWGDEESRPAIEEATKTGSSRLRRSAEMALKRLDQAAKRNPD